MNVQTPQELQQHLADADAVIVGTVSSVNLPEQEVGLLAAGQVPSRPVTEHDPHWREATIEVASVEHGDLPAQRTTVLFPASRDVAWYGAPKFQAGQKGVFVLHQQEIPELHRTAYVALHPVDYHPPEQLPYIRSVMQAGQ